MLHHNKAGEPCGLITNIQKYTIHDGPGIRTEFFFKGCPLRCPWCSNPETIETEREIGVYPTKCVGREKCGYCTSACPLGAETPLRFGEDGLIQPFPLAEDCRNCFLCADACPGSALKIWGTCYTVPELLKIAEEDRSFYDRTGGGITVSGGDVVLQWEFAADFLEACHQKGLNICVETEAYCSPEHLDAVVKYADLLMFDIKHIDSDVHKKLFGVGNERILQNIARCAAQGHKIVIRTPVVIGYNADADNIRGIASFLKEHVVPSLVQYQLLPYRKLGTEKYDSLGREYPLASYVPPEREEWEKNLLYLRDLVQNEFGIPVAAGTSGKLPL